MEIEWFTSHVAEESFWTKEKKRTRRLEHLVPDDIIIAEISFLFIYLQSVQISLSSSYTTQLDLWKGDGDDQEEDDHEGR